MNDVKEMNMQEVFDIVARHLLTQMAVSTDGYGSCAYRGAGGKMCAIGVLIKDDFYNEELEDCDVENSGVLWALRCSGVRMGRDMVRMLAELQRIHDRVNTNQWAEKLALTAQYYKLDNNVINS